MKYLSTIYGNNIPLALRCARYYQTKGQPFTAAQVKINNQTMKKLASKGILTIVSGERSRETNYYIVPAVTIDLLERRFPGEL